MQRKIGKRHSQAVKYMIPTPQYADSEDKYTAVKQKVVSSYLYVMRVTTGH